MGTFCAYFASVPSTGESSMMMLVAISYSIVPQHDDMADDNIVYSVKY